jgi:inorganic phosphate transporter, PiT family
VEMNVEMIVFALALLFGFYMAWSVGANDVANAMGTSVGSGALTLKRAVILAAILEFSGAFFVGSHVSETVRKGIVDTQSFNDQPMLLAYGMLAAMLAAAAWLQFASYYGWPISTTHSIVGAIIGFGVVVGGVSAVHWEKVGAIVSSWVISPLLSGTIAFFLFSFIRRKVFDSATPVLKAKQLTPYLVFFVFSILSLVMVFKGLKNLHLDLPLTQALFMAVGIGLVAAVVSHFLLKNVQEVPDEAETLPPSWSLCIGLGRADKNLKKALESSSADMQPELEDILERVGRMKAEVQQKTDSEMEAVSYQKVERIFVYLQILSAGFVAFAHGANDVANAIGPLAAVINIVQTGAVSMKSAVPTWVLALGGIGIIVGLATWGWRVIETVGKRITDLTPSRGFSAEFSAAITIVLASKLGIPISTTHTLVGAVLGVGMARGLEALNLRTVRDIVISWVVTIPVGAVLTILLFYIFRWIFE